MSYMENMDVNLVDIPMMYLLSVRKYVLKNDYEVEYAKYFGQLFRKVTKEKLTLAAPPSMIFHSKEEQMAFNKAKYVDGWVVDPMGVHTAGWELTLSVSEMTKIRLATKLSR